MAFKIKKIKDWKLRKIAFTMLILLVLILAGSFLILRFLGLSQKDIYFSEDVSAITFQVEKLSPDLLKAKKDHNLLKDEIYKIDKKIVVLLHGGEVFYQDEVLNMPAAKGDLVESAKDFKTVWDPYKSDLLDIVDHKKELNDDVVKQLSAQFPALVKKSETLKEDLYKNLEQTRHAQYLYLSLIFIFSLLVFLFVYYTMRNLILGPIFTISQTSRKLAKGNLSDEIKLNSRNEIGYIARNINSLADILKNASEFTRKIGEGNLDAEYKGLDELDQEDSSNNLASSLIQMRDEMKKAAVADKQRSWVNEGLAKFGDILRNNSDNLKDLSFEIISNLVKYLGINQGALFIINEDDESHQYLELRAAYAYDRKKHLQKEVEIGEGLIGQVYQEGEKIYITEIPEDYVTIKSGLGDATPKSLLVVPMKINEDIQGVVELAAFEEIPEYQIEFVEKLGENIASTISNTKVNERTKKLLSESQEMTEQLRSQEEEMRQNMEEMEATQEEMRRAQRELEEKEANLNALINNTEDSIITIDTNYKVMVMNDVLRRRYKGTQYEGVDAGANALDMLGDVRDEWKAYYDRALGGEKLQFVIKSSVQGENTYREYNLNPIKDNAGTIVGASIFSRDVTKQTLTDIENRKLLRDLNQKNKLFNSNNYFLELNADYTIEFVNELTLHALDYDKGDLKGEHVNKIFADEEYLKKGIAEMEKGNIYEEDIKLKKKDGSTLDVHSASTAVMDEEGKVAKYILIFTA